MTEFNPSSKRSLISNSEQQPAKAVMEAQADLDRLIASLSAADTQPDVVPDEASNEASSEAAAAPVYLLLSNKSGLTEKYGQLGFTQLDRDLHELKRTVGGQMGLDVIAIYVDDQPSLAPHDLQAVDPTNPWQIKLLVDNLDARLRAQGQEIRYLLIVGGHAIIPFHRLPNPVDDQDADVLSDNPYASRDANYFIPERAVGRIPDGKEGEIKLLHTLLQTAIGAHRRPVVADKGLWEAIKGTLGAVEQSQQNGTGFGYSASIWRKASRAVFEVIGDNRHLRTSPPLTYQELEIAGEPHFSYFNLHGVEDGANWYGQRDALFPANYPLFPVALRPQDLDAIEHANSVVFTEACYGANILGKGAESSIALRFLASQALAVVGSTKVSYGSIAPPLLGADLLGRYFWKGLQAHLTVGEALRYAKVNLAQEMQERQGYLDGEDQKALISFVLYGDPSLPAGAAGNGAAAKALGKDLRPSFICQKRAALPKGALSDKLVAGIKTRIEASLPHMAEARVRALPLKLCNGSCGHRCAHAAGKKSCEPVASVRSGRSADKSVTGKSWELTLEKDIAIQGDGAHRQVVKVTVDEGGHILKVAVSK